MNKTNKELGEIGAKAAFEAGSRVNWLMAVHDGMPKTNLGYSAWRGDAPARTAFAAAVREAVEKERAEEIAQLTAEVKKWQREAKVENEYGAQRTSDAARLAVELTKANAELERLRWRSVEVKS